MRAIYEKRNHVEGRVNVENFHKFYKGFLREQNIDLVVFLKKYFDLMVYDSRVDKNGNVRFTDKIMYLWLNDNHYDVILDVKIFSKNNLTNFCFRCMTYYTQFEYQDNHVCKNYETCQRC